MAKISSCEVQEQWRVQIVTEMKRGTLLVWPESLTSPRLYRDQSYFGEKFSYPSRTTSKLFLCDVERATV